MVYRESDEQRERDLRRYMQIAEARSKAAAAREVASNIQNKNNQSVNYQVRNLADSTKAVMNMPLDPEYVQKSTASWDRDVATTAKIKEESPGLLSRIGTMYTDWTRPFVAPAYYATLKAREAITGDDTGVKRWNGTLTYDEQRTVQAVYLIQDGPFYGNWTRKSLMY